MDIKEKIAKELYSWDDKPFLDESHYRLAAKIHAAYKEALPELAKEAGYLTPKEIRDMFETLVGGYSKLAERLGYVKLTEDQSLPDKLYIKFKANPELTMPQQREVADTAVMAYEQAQQDMVREHWRRVELEG